ARAPNGFERLTCWYSCQAATALARSSGVSCNSSPLRALRAWSAAAASPCTSRKKRAVAAAAWSRGFLNMGDLLRKVAREDGRTGTSPPVRPRTHDYECRPGEKRSLPDESLGELAPTNARAGRGAVRG